MKNTQVCNHFVKTKSAAVGSFRFYWSVIITSWSSRPPTWKI